MHTYSPFGFTPEPLERLRFRLPAAIADVHEPRDPMLRRPTHIFEFDDGLRLVISREHLPCRCGECADGRNFVHVVASAEPGTLIAPLVYDDGESFVRMAWARIALLFESKTAWIEPNSRGSIGEPHWYLEFVE